MRETPSDAGDRLVCGRQVALAGRLVCGLQVALAGCRRLHRSVGAAMVAAVAAAFLPACGSAPAPEVGQVAGADYWVLAYDDEADLVDAIALPREDWDGAGSEVVARLQATFEESVDGDPVVAELDRQGAQWQPLWIGNAVKFQASQEFADWAAGQDGVAEVVGGSELLLGPVPPEGTARVASVLAGGVEPSHLAAVGAPQVWATGTRGAGSVVGVIDTGVDVAHPALAGQWRAEAGWFDPVDGCDEPCDPDGHGTNVAGLAVGEQVGVAPDAQWIAARGCVAERCALDLVVESLQFMLAPHDPGDDPDPALRPEVVVSSWSVTAPSVALARTVAAMARAGVVGVYAAGNSGPDCDTVAFPAGQPDTVAVGALAADGQVADYSARGGPGAEGEDREGDHEGAGASRNAGPIPAVEEGPALLAPGDGLVTTRSGGGFTSATGTSMAAPQVAGMLALVYAAHPGARGSRDAVVAAVRASDPVPSADCGGEGERPSPAAGWGKVDVPAALAAQEP